MEFNSLVGRASDALHGMTGIEAFRTVAVVADHGFNVHGDWLWADTALTVASAVFSIVALIQANNARKKGNHAKAAVWATAGVGAAVFAAFNGANTWRNIEQHARRHFTYSYVSSGCYEMETPHCWVDSRPPQVVHCDILGDSDWKTKVKWIYVNLKECNAFECSVVPSRMGALESDCSERLSAIAEYTGKWNENVVQKLMEGKTPGVVAQTLPNMWLRRLEPLLRAKV